MSRSRWCAVAAVGALVGLSVGAVVGPARAEGSAFPAYSMSASAQGVGAIAAGRIDAAAPDTNATYSTGDVGYARAANVWPGSLAANAGDALPLLLGSFPRELEPIRPLLSYPARAEARAPAGPADVTFDAVPGLTMRATAVQGGAVASAHLQRLESDEIGALGTVRTDSSARLAGDQVASEATSSITHVDVLGGLLKIGSVTSHAVATSDGTKGTARASTTVAGVTVLGTPATIDDRGLTLGTVSNPIDDALSAVLTQALSAAGIEVVVGEAVEEVDGRSGKAGAGTVLISIDAQGTPVALTLGGANAAATASPDDAGALGEGAPSPSDTGSFDVGIPSSGLDLGRGAATASPSAASGPGAEVAAATPISLLGSATTPGLVLLGALAALLCAVLLRRLSTRLFEHPSGCTAGGSL